MAMESGITTVEIKTGYGLDLKNELKMLRVIEQLRQEYPARIVATFMGAHAVPADRRADPDNFVDEICNVWIPEVAKTVLPSLMMFLPKKKRFHSNSRAGYLKQASGTA
jgi:imidazolonepropionase